MTLYLYDRFTSSFPSMTLAGGDELQVVYGGIIMAPNSVLSTAEGTSATISIEGQVYLSRVELHGADMMQIELDGIFVGTSNTGAIMLHGTGGLIENSGLIEARRGSAIVDLGQDSTIANSGTICANSTAVRLGEGGSLDNSGGIFGRGAGVSLEGATGSLLNHGTIRGRETAVLVLGEHSDTGLPGQLRLVNHGDIASDEVGVCNLQMIEGSRLTLVNSGTISGQSALVSLGASRDVVVNRGTIEGDVGLGGGHDRLDSARGTITGDVSLGDGNDRADVSGGVTGQVMGGLGADLYVIAQSGVDLVEVGQDVDGVLAACSYRLAALIENLTLTGEGDHDGIGNALGNVIVGNGGDNRLSGLGGFDTLSGEAGRDRLEGGTGKDEMIGGSGADRFIFAGLAESEASTTLADVILDFTSGSDRIDLRQIDADVTDTGIDDAFTYLGSAAFTGQAGELRVWQEAGDTWVGLDVTGDGQAECLIRLAGQVLVTEADFLL